MSKFTTGSVNTSLKSLVAGCIMKLIITSILVLLVQVSFTVIATGVGTKEIGYTVLHSADGEGYTEVYKYYFSDGEDTKLEKYQNEENYYKVAIRSELSKGTINGINIAAVIIGMIILIASVYNSLWRAGDAVANSEEFGHTEPDKFYGVKAGLLAEIPFAATYIALIIGKLCNNVNITGTVFKISNYFMFPYINFFIVRQGSDFTVSPSGIAALFPVLLVLPIICSICYQMGHSHFIIKDRIIYKNGRED